MKTMRSKLYSEGSLILAHSVHTVLALLLVRVHAHCTTLFMRCHVWSPPPSPHTLPEEGGPEQGGPIHPSIHLLLVHFCVEQILSSRIF